MKYLVIISKGLFDYMHTLIRSDILDEASNAQKPTASRKNLALPCIRKGNTSRTVLRSAEQDQKLVPDRRRRLYCPALRHDLRYLICKTADTEICAVLCCVV
jgi:hypothetical protein